MHTPYANRASISLEGGGGGGGDLGQINNFLFESKVTNSQIMHVGPLSNIVLEIMVPDRY